ncbi:uncharacterized protein N0V89_012415 [Didymosphaeria variabile]|uniref:Dynactin arp1 p25 subunit protein n=1 Tax=Didymosphaeria variabile TaxID=1932322 RepID=A0A9W9C5E4_9PLEO|nr:uncharacterized protein N0V89_012415 [Didymosphaeria variabile]KAJ4344671.1 hypothetical protein N0V89_012415 [Didymosphaeria variabile]
MFTSRIVIAGFIAASTASIITEEQHFATLLKRQAPGSPEYACHDNCGTAITVSKAGGDYCTDEVFLYDYNNCLQCAGPDNVDIWKYYGGSLTTAAGKCSGLDTEPKSGKQDDVGDAKHPGDSTGASSAASSSTPTSTAEAVSEPASSAAEAVTDAPSSSAAEATATASEASSAAASLSSAVESAVSSAVSSVLETATAVPVPSVSGAPYATGNGTTNGTSPTASAPTGQFTGGAETVQVRNVVALIGAVAAFGAFY